VILMSGPELPNSRTYGNRAKECRRLAETFKHSNTRDRMLRTAADYDRLAMKSLERELADAAALRTKSLAIGSQRLATQTAPMF
jgi:hypothetical protein